MNSPSKHSTTEVIDGGTDPVTGYRTSYVRRMPVMIEVEYGFGAASLTLHHFPVQRQPRDISHNLDVLPRRTFEGAVKVAIALVEGREAASANRPEPTEWTNPWTEAEPDEPVKGHDVPDDLNGLQITARRYAESLKTIDPMKGTNR